MRISYVLAQHLPVCQRHQLYLGDEMSHLWALFPRPEISRYCGHRRADVEYCSLLNLASWSEKNSWSQASCLKSNLASHLMLCTWETPWHIHLWEQSSFASRYCILIENDICCAKGTHQYGAESLPIWSAAERPILHDRRDSVVWLRSNKFTFDAVAW